ncbi:MAG TPA: CZB domain-containing protein, partial [Patescibacteria group bacterium]|nr:CZB domain-containing protein [Patescibacteria group bacterium]
MNTVKLDFEQAKAKHLLFKSRLRALLYGGEVDETPVVSHHECAVGKWIYGHALKDYGHYPE